MALQLKIVGVLLMLLSLLHLTFPKYFNWKQELSSLSLINRQLMYVHTFFIALVVFLMGMLCLNSSAELLNTSLGKQISLVFAIFWSVRLSIQFFGYSSKLWRGRRFETTVHVLFSVFWTYLSAVFVLVYLA
jgi:hypothetical protein